MIVRKFLAPRATILPGHYGPVLVDAYLARESGIKPIFDRKGQIGMLKTMAAKIILREQDGTTTEVPKGRFVEICDEDNKIACLLYYTNKGSVRMVMPDDIKEVQHYKDIFKVDFCSTVVDVSTTINDSLNPQSNR